MQDFMAVAPVLMGAFTQYFMRQFSGVPEWAAWAAIVAAGLALYAFGTPHFSIMDRAQVWACVQWIASAAGWSRVTNLAAQGAVKLGANPGHPLIPITDSIGG